MNRALNERRGESVALGFFDGVHAGHRAVIEKAVEMAGDTLVPAAFTFSLNGAAMPNSKAGLEAIMTDEQKKNALSALGIKHIVCPDFSEFGKMSGEEFFKKILIDEMNAKAICCGEDFRFGKFAACSVKELRELCDKSGVELCVLQKISENGGKVSSTRIRRAVKEGDVKLAEKLLGRLFTIEAEVIGGRQLGRKIGAPTVNQEFYDGALIPQFGVYATVTKTDSGIFPSVTNVGVKPTVGSDKILAETHIIGFDGDLYGKTLVVGFVEKLRGEKKFDDIDSLKAQIADDARLALNIADDFIKTALQAKNNMLY